jgi:hypothetical protein
VPANWFRVNSNGTLVRIKSLFRVNSNGTLANLSSLFRVNSNGTLVKVFESISVPVIQDTVEISRNRNYHNSTYPVTLTGRKYHFTGATSFSYRFYSSPNIGGPWMPITEEITTTNPSSGSSSTVSYELVDADFTSNTMYFQFAYTGTNTSPNPDISTTSVSTPISVDYLAIPSAPPGFPFINQSTISVASTASTGTWNGSPTLYDWSWQYNDGGYKTLTYQANKSISSISLSGTTATVVSFDHGFKVNDAVNFSGINDLFNQSNTAISSVFTNFFSYDVSKTSWSFLNQYSVNNYVTYNGTIYRALLATPNRTIWSFTTNYTTNQYADYNNQLYIATSNTPTPRSNWALATSYTTNQYVNYSSKIWQCTLSNTGQTPFEGSIYWSSIDVTPGSSSYWTLVNIYPTSTTYWQSQEGATASSGTATGPNYYEGTSSSPVSYNIPSFPSTDYKTGTSLLSKLTRMAVTVYNAVYNASANSSARTIYGYPSIFLGTVSRTSTTASIPYVDVDMNSYDLDVKRQVSVSSAVVSGSNIIYTTSVPHTFSSSASVTLTGFSPSTFNISGIGIISSTSNTFTISNVTGATGSATTSGSALASISGYPKNSQTAASPISITGLSAGGAYTVYVTPKNADFPAISGVQKTTTFTTPITPVNTVLPSITPLNNRSNVPVSTVITCSPGSWTGVDANTVYSYNWEYYESSTIGWVSLNITTNTYTTQFVGDIIRCTVTATNGSQSTSATSTSHTVDQQVAVSLVSPTNPTVNVSTNFTFNISHYPTSYVVDWGDGTSNNYTVSSNTSTVNASIAKTYSSTGNRTITVTAQPGNISRSTNIVVGQPLPIASGFARADVTATPSDPSVISFSSANNQVTSTWTNGSPITSVVYSYSGAGTNGGLTDTTFPFVASDLTSYSQSGTYTFTVTNFNNNFVIRVSWNQANAQSYIIYYSGSSSGANSIIGNSSASSVSVDIPWSSANGSFTFTNLNVYSSTDQNGTSSSYSTGLTGITPSAKISTRTSSTSLTYVLPKLATPTGVNASDNRTDGVNITWNAVSGAAYYGIWYGGPPVYDSAPDFGGPSNPNLITGTSYLDTSLAGGVTRDYYVQAFRSGNPTGTKSDWGGPDSGTRVAIVSAPVNTVAPSVTPSSGTAGSTTFSSTTGTWSNSPTSYSYQWRFLDGSSWLSISGATSSTYTPPSNYVTLYGSSLRCYVTATNSGGSNTANSNTVTVSAGGGGSAPATPTGVGLSGSGVVSWTASSGATSYEIEFYTAQSGTGLNAAGPYTVTGISASPYQLVSPYASPNNWARVRVRARNGVGPSSYSAWVPSATTYT